VVVGQRDLQLARDLADCLGEDRRLLGQTVPWRGRAEDDDRAVVQTLPHHLPRLRFILLDLQTAQVIGAEHDQRHFRIEILQPGVHVLVCPADGHHALVSVLGPAAVPAVFEHIALDQFEGLGHLGRGVLTGVLQPVPEGLRHRDRVAKQGQSPLFSGEFCVYLFHGRGPELGVRPGGPGLCIRSGAGQGQRQAGHHKRHRGRPGRSPCPGMKARSRHGHDSCLWVKGV